MARFRSLVLSTFLARFSAMVLSFFLSSLWLASRRWCFFNWSGSLGAVHRHGSLLRFGALHRGGSLSRLGAFRWPGSLWRNGAIIGTGKVRRDHKGHAAPFLF